LGHGSRSQVKLSGLLLTPRGLLDALPPACGVAIRGAKKAPPLWNRRGTFRVFSLIRMASRASERALGAGLIQGRSAVRNERWDKLEAWGERLGWVLAWGVLGSLGTLAALYLAEPDVDRRRRNLPLPPYDLGIEDPLYRALWTVVAVGILLMAGSLLLGSRRIRFTADPGPDSSANARGGTTGEPSPRSAVSPT